MKTNKGAWNDEGVGYPEISKARALPRSSEYLSKPEADRIHIGLNGRTELTQDLGNFSILSLDIQKITWKILIPVQIEENSGKQEIRENRLEWCVGLSRKKAE